MTQYRDQLRVQLAVDEGRRGKPYRDTVGKLTIGVGRNLDDVGLSPDEIGLLLENDINRAEAAAMRLVPGFALLSDARKCVIVNMAFNMGAGTLATFTSTLSAINRGQWRQAAAGMRDSLWAKQVGARAERLAKMMEQG